MKTIELIVKGQQVPCFKNRKHSGRGGFVYCDPKVKKRMEAVTQSFVSQLISECQTIERATLPGCSKLSLIASLLPADDSWQWIPEQHVTCQRVLPGAEGCRITIERIE